MSVINLFTADTKRKLKEKRVQYTLRGIAKKHNVAESYVSMIASGERKAVSDKAKKIRKDLEDVNNDKGATNAMILNTTNIINKLFNKTA